MMLSFLLLHSTMNENEYQASFSVYMTLDVLLLHSTTNEDQASMTLPVTMAVKISRYRSRRMVTVRNFVATKKQVDAIMQQLVREEKQPLMLAACCGQHSRLGSGSIIRHLDEHVLTMIWKALLEA